MNKETTQKFTCDSCGKTEPPRPLRRDPAPEGWLSIHCYDDTGATWSTVHLCPGCGVETDFNLKEALDL